jgi:hypothetical protein
MDQANPPLQNAKTPFRDTIAGKITVSVVSSLLVTLITTYFRQVALGALIVAGVGAILLLIGYLSQAAPKALNMIGLALYGALFGWYIGTGVSRLFFHAPYSLPTLLADMQHPQLTSTGQAFVLVCIFIGALVGAIRAGRH